jgi:hypothetical protein
LREPGQLAAAGLQDIINQADFPGRDEDLAILGAG